jgi:hypothetical protein
MTAATNPAPVTRTRPMAWAGWGLTALFTLFMTFDIAIKLIDLQVVGDTLAALGYPRNLGRLIGVIELACLALYLNPRTSVLGAVLFTAVMGGAVATHLRLDNPLFSHTLFGVYLGLMLWGGLWLRDGRLRALFPLRI